MGSTRNNQVTYTHTLPPHPNNSHKKTLQQATITQANPNPHYSQESWHMINPGHPPFGFAIWHHPQIHIAHSIAGRPFIHRTKAPLNNRTPMATPPWSTPKHTPWKNKTQLQHTTAVAAQPTPPLPPKPRVRWQLSKHRELRPQWLHTLPPASYNPPERSGELA